MDEVRETARLIKDSKFIVALTGAGISTNAGIPDFRGPKGVYTLGIYDPDKVFDIDYFLMDPMPFYNFAREFVSLLEKVKPTFTHTFLARLESQGKLKAIITQNIDLLHEKSGSKNIINLHGTFLTSHCTQCGKKYSYEDMKEKIFKERIPKCEKCGGVIKPDIVFFKEGVRDFDKAVELSKRADLFFVIGTSLKVYPASMLPQFTRGKIIVVGSGDINLKFITPYLVVRRDIDEFFKEVSKELEVIK